MRYIITVEGFGKEFHEYIEEFIVGLFKLLEIYDQPRDFTFSIDREEDL